MKDEENRGETPKCNIIEEMFEEKEEKYEEVEDHSSLKIHKK